MKRGIAVITMVTLLGTSAPLVYANTTASTQTVTNVATIGMNQPTVWIVKSGDTLWKISQSTGVPVAQIAQYNGITNMASIYVGQGLKIPSIWTVKSGDTLWKIGQATGSSVPSIVQANGVTNADQIQVGSKLIIPRGTAAYTVQSGDTLWKIAQATGVTVQALVQANALSNPDSLTVGEVLKVPSATTATETGGTATGAASAAPTTGSASSGGSASGSSLTTPRQDVAVVLSDGTKAQLPYSYEDANGMKITFNSMSRETLTVTVTNTDPVNNCVIQPKLWSITAAGGYSETTPIYVSPSLIPGYFSGNQYASIAPGQSITGTIGFGAFSADNGQFTLHFGFAKGDLQGDLSVVTEQDSVTFATGTNATGATAVSTPASDEAVTVNAATATTVTGATDAIWVGTSPMALTGTPTYQVTAVQGGDASTASVDPTTHMFTAQAPGTYRVSATVNGIASTTANSAVINVIGSPATINMGSNTVQFAYNPTTFTLDGAVKDQSATGVPYATVTYSSDNPSVVSANGTATSDQYGNIAIPISLSAMGTAHITITAGSVSTVVTVNVTAPGA